MNKICSCADPDIPDISLNVTCACCESRVQQRKTNELPDLDKEETKDLQKVEKEEEEEKYTVCCCCFRRKRHAKDKKKKNRTRNGSRT